MYSLLIFHYQFFHVEVVKCKNINILENHDDHIFVNFWFLYKSCKII